MGRVRDRRDKKGEGRQKIQGREKRKSRKERGLKAAEPHCL